MTQNLNTEQWTKLLSLLSLDSALPLYEDMGVPVADKSVFQKTLREVILDARRQYDANRNSVPPVAGMLLERLDSATATQFADWARGVFLGYHADQPEWSAWDIVFSQWAYGPPRILDFLLEAKRDSFAAGYRVKAATDDVKEKAQGILGKPLSNWDLEMFARQGYGRSWESTPYSTAEWIARIERLKRFADEVWHNLTPSEKEEFQKRAQALIDQLGVWMPGPLPQLDALLTHR